MVNSSTFCPIYRHPKFTVMALFRAGQFVYYTGSKSPSTEINDIHTYRPTDENNVIVRVNLQDISCFRSFPKYTMGWRCHRLLWVDNDFRSYIKDNGGKKL